MGNNPSSTTPKQATTPGSASPQEAGITTSRPSNKRDSRSIIPIHTTQRSAAPPEESLAQATRASVVHHPSSKSLPQPVSSLAGSGSPSSSSAAGAANGGILGASSAPTQHPKPPDGGRSAAMDVRDEPSKPVDVPVEPSSARSHHIVEPPLVSQSSITDMSYLTRPPRMPLPIEEEVHTPGSPIIAPSDAPEAVGDEVALDSDTMTRKSSALSNTTIDEDEAEELIVDKTQPSVPTKLEWKRGGDRVYVTGSIFQWNKKHRLSPVEGKPGVFASTIHIHPGIHHVRFLVDGMMQTSPDLPTTVDFGNNLVNYIEVSPDDVPASAKGGPPTAPSKAAEEKKLQQPPKSESQVKEQKLQRGRSVLPAESYLHQIPPYLIDFDQSEDTPSYQYAVTAIEKLPNPPGLPQFLSKPILNASASIKDDNSVLIMPNHTVLNHLGTSSIKNNILALSATTRYKHKYVTTIIYKPASNDG